MSRIRVALAFGLSLTSPLLLAQNSVESAAPYQIGRVIGIALFVLILWRLFGKKKS